MSELFGHVGDLGWVALKAFLLYLTAVFGFRLGKPRTLAEMAPFDFVAAVAVGAIVGRVPNATGTSYLEGLVTLVAIIATHRLVTRLRSYPAAARLFDFAPRLLIVDGRVRPEELRWAGMTIDDLYGLLRQQGIEDLKEIRYAVFEERGRISVLRRHADAEGGGSQPDLVRDLLEACANPPQPG